MVGVGVEVFGSVAVAPTGGVIVSVCIVSSLCLLHHVVTLQVCLRLCFVFEVYDRAMRLRFVCFLWHLSMTTRSDDGCDIVKRVGRAFDRRYELSPCCTHVTHVAQLLHCVSNTSSPFRTADVVFVILCQFFPSVCFVVALLIHSIFLALFLSPSVFVTNIRDHQAGSSPPSPLLHAPSIFLWQFFFFFRSSISFFRTFCFLPSL